MSAEKWLPVPGFDGYEASSDGRVRSVDRTLPDGRRAGGVILQPADDARGYPRVTVRASGKPQKIRVHVLVALAFKGPRPRGREVRHLDGVKVNCRPGNLAWGTKGTNELDKGSHRRQKVSQVLRTRLGRL